ncbi:hypothetical protein ACX8XP_02770 [Calditrichota bacterium LG25]
MSFLFQTPQRQIFWCKYPKAAKPQPKTNRNARKVSFSQIAPIIAEKD